MATDFELLDAWRAGDRDAGNELFQRHFESVCRFFRNKVRDGVEDLIQRTFLACVESRESFRKEATFRTYLFTVARNELFGHFRRVRKLPQAIDAMVVSVNDLGPSPSGILAKHAEERLLLRALRKIPVEHQVALELFYWEDLSASELARIVELPEGTVRSRLRRARALLVEEMQGLAEGAAHLESTVANLDEWARGVRAHLTDASE